MDKPSLTSNQLKILAMITMTVDHIGAYLLPQYHILRMIGRLAFPIYAYLIAEGCAHTRDRRRYLLQMGGMALICQLVYFFAMGSLYQCILVTFTLSILLIYAIDSGSPLLGAGMFLAVLFLTGFLPNRLPGFYIDYSLWGVLTPVAAYLGRNKREKLLFCGILLALLAADHSGFTQWLGLLSLIPLALYNGKRGKARIKWFFYLYYPLHLVAIYAIGFLF